MEDRLTKIDYILVEFSQREEDFGGGIADEFLKYIGIDRENSETFLEYAIGARGRSVVVHVIIPMTVAIAANIATPRIQEAAERFMAANAEVDACAVREATSGEIEKLKAHAQPGGEPAAD